MCKKKRKNEKTILPCMFAFLVLLSAFAMVGLGKKASGCHFTRPEATHWTTKSHWSSFRGKTTPRILRPATPQYAVGSFLRRIRIWSLFVHPAVALHKTQLGSGLPGVKAGSEHEPYQVPYQCCLTGSPYLPTFFFAHLEVVTGAWRQAQCAITKCQTRHN